MDLVEDDGVSRRDRLLQVEKSLGRTPEELLDEPAPPDRAEYLLRWFFELNEGRGSTGFGPAALSYLEIDAWGRLTETFPTSWEVAALKKLDAVYLEYVAKRQSAKSPRSSHRPRPPESRRR